MGKVGLQPAAPTVAELNHLVTLFGAGRLAELENQSRLLIERYPKSGFVWKALGAALRMQGKNALPALQKAADLLPDDAACHNDLGAALQELGQSDLALASYYRALKLDPGLAEVHCNLGNLQKDLGQLEQAAAGYRRALQIRPDYADAHNNLGNVLLDLGQLEPALACFRRALEIKPDYAEAHSNLGSALRDLGQLDGAVASCRRALELRPDLAEVSGNLLYVLNYTPGLTPAYYLEQAQQFGRVVAGKAGTRYSAWKCEARPARLRVGMVSGDLRKHSVGYFVEGLLAHIDPARIELIAYPTSREEDELTTRIKPHFSAWKPIVGLNDEAAARLIHDDGVHILIDLSGHTAHNRLPVFAWKPAPVQVSWLGLPATTGVAEIDYVLGDPHAIPPEFEDQFSEVVWRMPESYLCFTVPATPVKIEPLPALSAGFVTFGSFNNLTKMNDKVVAVWARILKSVPDSRLLLKTKQLGEQSVCDKVRKQFVACGIAPDRLLLIGRIASREDHLAAYNRIDIALDTFPYPGVTTSAEALWMGVPVLSLRGDRFLSRTAVSIACNAGLPEWIAAGEDDYVAKAVAFASDLESLARLRAGLRQQVLASPLFDVPRFARNFENALWGMWQAHENKQPER